MDFPKIETLNTGTKKAEWYIKKHYPEFYQYLIDNFPFCLTHIERLYCYYNNIHTRPTCKSCGKPTKFVNSSYGYTDYCCYKCMNSDPVKNENRKKTYLEKYGVENPSLSLEIQNKKKKTCLEKYGVESYSKTDEYKKRYKETLLDHYGVDNPLKSDIIKKKIKKTNLKKYGCEWNIASDHSRNETAKTLLEKYGDSHYSNREKMQQTCLKKYGCISPMGNEKIKEKKRKTFIDKYGTREIFSLPEIREKIRRTHLEKYGVDNIFKKKTFWKEYGDKIKQSCLEKYGVEYYCLTPECQKACHQHNSTPNIEFEKILRNNEMDFEREYRIGNRLYDFKVDNILVEINPYPTHNINWNPFNKPVDKEYHLSKTVLAQNNGYRCIHVWDWDSREKVIKLLKNESEIIYARSCQLKEVDKKECNDFLDKYHLQNKCNNQIIRLGLYYKGKLVQLMTFGKPRYSKKYEWELLRLCGSKKVVGGSEKIFKYFINKVQPKSIISYCDNSKFSGDVYERLNFVLKSKGIPSKHWYNGKIHVTDNLLRQRGFDQLFKTNYGKGTSNEQLMFEHGFVEIYDAGQSTYIWTKKEE